jgi:hypothetical protein
VLCVCVCCVHHRYLIVHTRSPCFHLAFSSLILCAGLAQFLLNDSAEFISLQATRGADSVFSMDVFPAGAEAYDILSEVSRKPFDSNAAHMQDVADSAPIPGEESSAIDDDGEVDVDPDAPLIHADVEQAGVSLQREMTRAARVPDEFPAGLLRDLGCLEFAMRSWRITVLAFWNDRSRLKDFIERPPPAAEPDNVGTADAPPLDISVVKDVRTLQSLQCELVGKLEAVMTSESHGPAATAAAKTLLDSTFQAVSFNLEEFATEVVRKRVAFLRLPRKLQVDEATLRFRRPEAKLFHMHFLNLLLSARSAWHHANQLQFLIANIDSADTHRFRSPAAMQTLYDQCAAKGDFTEAELGEMETRIASAQAWVDSARKQLKQLAKRDQFRAAAAPFIALDGSDTTRVFLPSYPDVAGRRAPPARGDDDDDDDTNSNNDKDSKTEYTEEHAHMFATHNANHDVLAAMALHKMAGRSDTALVLKSGSRLMKDWEPRVKDQVFLKQAPFGRGLFSEPSRRGKASDAYIAKRLILSGVFLSLCSVSVLSLSLSLSLSLALSLSLSLSLSVCVVAALILLRPAHSLITRPPSSQPSSPVLPAALRHSAWRRRHSPSPRHPLARGGRERSLCEVPPSNRFYI